MASSDGTGKIYFSKQEWIDFVIELAPFLKRTSFELGPITSNEEGYEVEYAFGDEVPPSEWANPPRWLKKGA